VVGFLPDCRSIQARARVSVDIRQTHSSSLKGTRRYALRMQTGGNASTLEQLALHSEYQLRNELVLSLTLIAVHTIMSVLNSGDFWMKVLHKHRVIFVLDMMVLVQRQA
jgi:hypothetical protein